MTMIKLSDGCYVAADQIAEVQVYPSTTWVTVRMKSGGEHSSIPEYGESVYGALDRIVKEINAATSEEKR